MVDEFHESKQALSAKMSNAAAGQKIYGADTEMRLFNFDFRGRVFRTVLPVRLG